MLKSHTVPSDLQKRFIPLQQPQTAGEVWVNQVESNKYHLFATDGLLGPEVRPIIYNPSTTAWLLQHERTKKFYLVFECNNQSFELIKSDWFILDTVENAVAMAVDELNWDLNSVEPDAYGGRRHNHEEYLSWLPWSFPATYIGEDQQILWRRYPIPEKYRAKICGENAEWTNDPRKLQIKSEFTFLRPVATENLDQGVDCCPSYTTLHKHIRESRFYISIAHDEGNCLYQIARTEGSRGKPANLTDEEVFDWFFGGLQDGGDIADDEDGQVVDGLCKVEVDVDRFHNDQYLLEPWNIATDGEPGEKGLEDWEQWLKQTTRP